MAQITSKGIKVLYIYDKLPETYQNYLWLPVKKLKQEVTLKLLSYHPSTLADFSLGKPSILEKITGKLSRYTSIKKIRKDVAIMKRFDVLHIQHSYLFYKIDIFKSIPENKKPKLVITLRGGDTYIKPWIAKKWLDFYSTNSKHIKAFVVVSNHQKDYLQKWGVPASKIHVIPVSFGEATQAKPKFPNTKVMKIVSAHRLCWEKNIDANLRFIKKLHDKGVPVKYDIYGDGPNKGQLLFLIDKYKLDTIVQYHNKINNDTLKALLNTYDFFLQLSISESLGVSVLEAQSKGVPVIVSDAGGLPETLEVDKSGYIVGANQTGHIVKKVISLWNTKEEYFSFSERAISHSHEKYTVEHEVNRLKNLYNNVLETK